MTGKETVESFNNAWRAMAKRYTECPDETLRCSMNLLAKIIGEVESRIREEETQRRNREGQITLDEWAAMLQEGF